MNETISNPALNLFSADVVSEIIASENAIDFAFENTDFPVTFKRIDFPAGTEFSTKLRIRFKCTSDAGNRLLGKEFSIPFYSTKYILSDDGSNIVDHYTNRAIEETAMRFTDELTFTKQEIALPESGPMPKAGKMFAYNRLSGYAKYLEDKEAKVSFFTLRDAILKTPVVKGQEKNYLRKLTTSSPIVLFYNPDLV